MRKTSVESSTEVFLGGEAEIRATRRIMLLKNK